MSKKYTVKYFIKKFSAIPDDQWRCDGNYGRDGQPKCALGHCGLSNNFTHSTEESDALYKVLAPVGDRGVTWINDAPSKKFPQATPKARILAALEFAKAL